MMLLWQQIPKGPGRPHPEKRMGMKKKTALRGRKISLKWELISIILACWILPVGLLGWEVGYYINNSINSRIADTVTSSAENSVKNALNQLNSAISASRYASYNGTVQSAYLSYLQTGDGTALYGGVRNFLMKEYKYDDRFLLTMLYFTREPDNVYFTYSETYSGVMKYLNSVHGTVRKLSQTLGTGIGFLNVDGSVYMVRNILDSNYNTYAVLVMQLNLETVFGNIKNVAWATDTTVWINSTKVVLSGSDLQKDSSVDPSQSGLFYRNARSGTYVYGSSRMQDFQLSYVIRVNSAPLARELSGFRITLLAILALIVPLLGVAVWFFTRNVSVPIRRLIRQASRIEGGDFGVQVEDRFASTEFQQLANSFNSMSYKLKYQFERIYKEELALRDARIMALQLQINPHFLNNTLEIINWEARLADNVKVSRMIEALSTMLNAAVDRSGKPMVHLSEELMYVDAYLYIISERFGKRLSVTKKIDPALVDVYVPRLILQPVIENAVEHGIQAHQKGAVELRAFREEDSLVLEVENDGPMTAEDQERVRLLLSDDYDAEKESSGSLGIRNVNQRLKILFGKSSGLTIIMNSKNHTVARIVIAIVQNKQ